VVNVKDFGAAGDGVNDDTDAIRQAFDAANADADRTIFFPPGQYRFNGSLDGLGSPGAGGRNDDGEG
jgi:polygalacturonase